MHRFIDNVLQLVKVTMDLVPCSHSTSSHVDYWDKTFKKTGYKPLEWCGGYHTLSGILHKYIKPADRTLIIGGGSCRLSEKLYDVGYHSLVNIEASEAMTKEMNDKNSKQRPEMQFLKMDVAQMAFEDASVNVVLDQGLLDFTMGDGLETKEFETANCFFAEVHRILKIGGRYVCVTFAADHIMRHLLNYFSEKCWMIRLHRITRTNHGKRKTEAKSEIPVFAFICTKFKTVQGIQMPLEICMTDSATPHRVKTVEDIMTAIEDWRHYAMIRQQLQTRMRTDEGISVELYKSTKPESPRYTMHVVDSDKTSSPSKKFAIFITPQGRETEWMFSTDKGRAKLAASAGFQRLLVVSLHRDHTYTEMDSIKAELSCKVMELAPPGVDEEKQVPFLSIGDDIGQREVIYRGNSQYTGDFVVEDVRGEDGHIFRRLLFLSGTLIQSQARLKKERPRKGRHKHKSKEAGPKMSIDYSYLDFNFHKHMVAGLAVVPQFLELLDSEMRMLIVGLGGGILPMFLYKHFPKLLVDVVELDGAVGEIAKSCFDFVEDQRMKVYIGDGLEYIGTLAEDSTGPTYHIVTFDIDAKDLSTGLNSPPRPFIEKAFLKKVDSILHPQGVFMLNLISRDDTIKQDVVNDIKTIFPLVYTKSGKDEVNETLYAISRASRQKPLECHSRETLIEGFDSACPCTTTKEQLPSRANESTLNLASDLLGRLPNYGKELQKLAESTSKGLWDSDMDLSEILGKLEIR